MLIAYAQKPPVNVHAAYRVGIEVDLGVSLHSYFVYANCEGYGENAHLRRLAWAFIAGLYDMCELAQQYYIYAW